MGEITTSMPFYYGIQKRVVYTEQDNQDVGIVYRKICAEYSLDSAKSRWKTLERVVETDRATIL